MKSGKLVLTDAAHKVAGHYPGWKVGARWVSVRVCRAAANNPRKAPAQQPLLLAQSSGATWHLGRARGRGYPT